MPTHYIFLSLVKGCIGIIMAKSSSKVTMADLLSSKSAPSIQKLKRGQVVEGKVVSLTDHEALVNVGAKAEGVIPENELKGQDIVVGDSVLCYVISPEDRRGQIILSINRAKGIKDWMALKLARDDNDTLEVTVNGYNKGGLMVDVQGLQGFIPFSHSDVAGNFAMVSDAGNQGALDLIKGQTVKARIIELDQINDRIILSEKEAAIGEELEKRRKNIASITLGSVVEGTVSAVMPYGVMVDIEGIGALIPKEELSWDDDMVSQVLSEFEVGQKITSEVISVDSQLGKVQLSLKNVIADPWKELLEIYKKGDKTEGSVTKITSYGVFVSLPQTSIEGMIALSSLPSDGKLTIGTKIPVEITLIDPANKQVDLVYNG